MAASQSDKFKKVGASTVTSLAAPGKAIGATSITVGSTTNYPPDTGIVVAIRVVDTAGELVAGTYTEYTATVTSGTSLAISSSPIYGSDQVYAAGSTTQVYIPISYKAHNDLVDALLVQHTQTGAHGAITATSMASTGAVSGTTVTGTTLISTGDVQRRSVSTETMDTEHFFDYIASGGVWSGDAYGSTLNASMTAIVGYINGQRGTVSAVTARAFTASKDTYIDLLNTAGVFSLVYTEVANNAASPALAASSVRIGIIVSGAGNIAAVGSVNQGQETKVLPIASSIPYAVTDSLGNLICPRDPNRNVLGYRQIVADFTSTTTGSYADVTGLLVPIIAPTSGRKIEVTIGGYYMSTSAAAGTNVELVCNDVTAGAVIGGVLSNNAGASYALPTNSVSEHTPASGSRTYKVQFKTSAAGTFTLKAIATVPAYIRVKQV